MNKKSGRFLACLVVLAALAAFTNVSFLSKSKKKDFSRKRPRTFLVSMGQLDEKTQDKLLHHERLSSKERQQIENLELKAYHDLKQKGMDEVSFTKESVLLRDFRLRKKTLCGFPVRKSCTMSEILFPGVSPEEYQRGEQLLVYTDIVQSRISPVPFHVYDLPGYFEAENFFLKKKKHQRPNLGSRLLGHDPAHPAPFDIRVEKDMPCTVFEKSYIGPEELQWLRQLVERQHRVFLQLDSLPVLLKSHDLNFALPGYPVGFKLPDDKKIYLYNHLKFIITYYEDPDAFEGIRITGFDVHPVSKMHDAMGESCFGYDVENQISDRSTFVSLEKEFGKTPVLFSYDVRWELNDDVGWGDRWDVYLIGSLDDYDMHYFGIVNATVVVVVSAAVIASIMVCALQNTTTSARSKENTDRKAAGDKTTGWKALRGDVFRPPTFSPMLLSVLVGSGAQIGVTGVLAVLLSVLGFTNTMKHGEMLTSLIVLYALSGIVAGFFSSRIHKFCNAENWKKNAILTATALPGTFFFILFVPLNILLSNAGAATAASFSVMLVLFVLWVGVSVPLVFVGAYFGHKMPTIEAGSCTNQVVRDIPKPKMGGLPVLVIIAGGALPFFAFFIEVAFLMSANWFHQIYYTTGYLLTAVLIVLTTCAQVSIILCYMQLRAEDHRWWWKSFWNCASAGVYLFLYSLWYLNNRLRMNDAMSVTVYLTYMAMVSICFGICCGSVGFIASFWFTRTIYGHAKIDLNKVSTTHLLRSALLSLRVLSHKGNINSSQDDANDYHLLSDSDAEDDHHSRVESLCHESDNLESPEEADHDYHLVSEYSMELVAGICRKNDRKPLNHRKHSR